MARRGRGAGVGGQGAGRGIPDTTEKWRNAIVVIDWPEVSGIRGVLQSYKELRVWQGAYALCLTVCRITRSFPKDERYGLTSQLRRASVSVVSGIAEGYNRATTRDYMRFLHMASGSLAELDTQLLLAKDLGFGGAEAVDEALESVDELDRLLKALIRSLRRKRAAKENR